MIKLMQKEEGGWENGDIDWQKGEGFFLLANAGIGWQGGEGGSRPPILDLLNFWAAPSPYLLKEKHLLIQHAIG